MLNQGQILRFVIMDALLFLPLQNKAGFLENFLGLCTFFSLNSVLHRTQKNHIEKCPEHNLKDAKKPLVIIMCHDFTFFL